MKHALIIALLALAASGATLDVSPQGRVVLRSGGWIPSTADADAAYSCAQQFLDKPVVKGRYDRSQIALILRHSREYRVQFVGQYRRGKKIILCNFFPVQAREEKNDPFPYWRRELVGVSDGGFWFWQIEYDPQDNHCTNFDSNGYA